MHTAHLRHQLSLYRDKSEAALALEEAQSRNPPRPPAPSMRSVRQRIFNQPRSTSSTLCCSRPNFVFRIEINYFGICVITTRLKKLRCTERRGITGIWHEMSTSMNMRIRIKSPSKPSKEEEAFREWPASSHQKGHRNHSRPRPTPKRSARMNSRLRM